MANLHILEKAGEEVRVAAHVPVPNVNNIVGVNYRIAIVNSLLFGNPPTSALKTGDGTAGTISATEATQVATGQVVEVITTIRPGNAPNLNNYLDAEFSRIQTETQAFVQDRLKFFGVTR